MAARGFTLLELLVVIAIIGLMLAAVPGFLLRDSSRLDVDTAARAIANGLRETRSEAIASNRIQVFALDVEGRRFRPGAGRLHQLDRSLGLSLLTARTAMIGQTAGGIRFFPDGTSTGGEVRVKADGLVARITVDWLTGDVAIGDAP